MDMNKKTDRFNRITMLLRENGTVPVKELARQAHVSEMTIRRDLNELQKNHIIKRSHGSASLAGEAQVVPYENIEHQYTLSRALTSMRDEKVRIGRFAAGLIRPGDVIIIDNGSTTDCLADYIPESYDLTIACYNLNIITKLPKRDNIKLIFSGGFYHPSDQMFESADGINFLKNIRANKLFLSASGIHNKLGMTCAHAFEVGVKQAVLQSANQKILVVDSSKFGAIKTVFFAHLDQVDTIVTDTGLSQEWQELLGERGIELHLV